MNAFSSTVKLGRTGLKVGKLAVAGGYGVTAPALREAFERGVSYFYHGSLRRGGMQQAVREIVANGQRERLTLVLQSYSRWGGLLEWNLRRGMKQLNVDYLDVLLLGLHNRWPSPRLLEQVEGMRERGLFRHLAISSHNRPRFLEYASDPRFSLFHVRYNAAHPGAETDLFPRLPRPNRPGVVAFTATCWGQLLDPTRMPPGEPPMRARDCYRFVLTNPDFDVCLTGPRNAQEMREALAALDEGPCSAEEMDRFRRIGRHVHG